MHRYRLGLIAGFTALALGLAACGGGGADRTMADPPMPGVPSIDYDPKVPLVGGASCVAALTYTGAAFDRIGPVNGAGECGISTPVSMVGLQTAEIGRPITVDCGLASQLARYDRLVLQPVAQEMFGQGVREVKTFGGYACRGRTSNRARLSEHAFGRAVDIAGFVLTDGTTISIRDDWNAGGTKERFLRKVTAGACRMFAVVLTPNSDSDHYNHLHVDLGPWKKCGL